MSRSAELPMPRKDRSGRLLRPWRVEYTGAVVVESDELACGDGDGKAPFSDTERECGKRTFSE
jgi:hypothetical protein